MMCRRNARVLGAQLVLLFSAAPSKPAPEAELGGQRPALWAFLASTASAGWSALSLEWSASASDRMLVALPGRREHRESAHSARKTRTSRHLDLRRVPLQGTPSRTGRTGPRRVCSSRAKRYLGGRLAPSSRHPDPRWAECSPLLSRRPTPRRFLSATE